ncbi:restriction endonuclease subunit S [Campylobacter lari]|uniref:restriction endonuclease subunit S n=1 Tax=Campylobacter lari TaxID=201 RepID=UPI003DA0088F
MNNWKKCKLGDICSKITDGSHKSPPSQTSGFPMASVKDMEYNQINLNTCRKISKEDYLELVASGCQPEINDILIAKDGSYLKHVFRVRKKEELVLLSSIAIIRPILEQVCPQFLTYVFKNKRFIEEIETNYVTGAVIPRIVLRDFKEIEITLPPLEEQRQIAIILSSIDDKIELLHEQNKTLEKLAQTLFRHYFIENPNPSWQEKPLSDFGNIICGKTPSKNVDEYYNGDIPFIKIPDMHGNIFVFKTNECLSELGSQTQINKLIPKKSICVSCIATVGMVSMNAFESHTNQQINSIIPKKEHYRYFLYLYMKHLYDYLQSMASGGTATANLNTRDFSNIHILMPDEEMMINFNGKTSEYFDKIFKNLEQIQTLENMRDILIPKLLNGEIKINN